MGLMVRSAAEQRQMALNEARQSAFALIRPASFQYDRIIQETRQLLVLLAAHPQLLDPRKPDCHEFLASVRDKYPYYANIAMLNRQGEVTCSAIPFSGKLDLRRLPHAERAMRTGELAIGDYEIGPISNQAVLGFMYPIREADGRITGVLGATVQLSWLSQLAAQAHLPPGSAVMLVDHNGKVLAVQPHPEAWVGKNVARLPVVRTILEQKSGVVEGLGPDDQERLYSFSPLGGDPDVPSAYLAVGIPRQVAFAKADAMLGRNLAGMGLIGLFSLLVAWIMGDWFVLRKVQTLINATKRLASGDLSVRTGMPRGGDEFARLAFSFDEMAEALEGLTQRYELILNSAGEGIYGGDRDGVIQFINPTAAHMVGYEVEELVGRNGHALLHHSRPDGCPYPASECPVLQTVQDGRVRSVTDEVFWRKDGSMCPIEYLVSPIRKGGHIVGVVLLIKDLSERRKAELEQTRLKRREEAAHAELEAVKQLDAMKNNFVNAVSHDLRTPLTSIMGYAEFLDEEIAGPLTPQQRDFITQIERGAKRLEFLVNDLLDFARLDAGTFALRREPIDLRTAIQAISESAQPQAADAHVAIQVDLPDESLVAMLDAPRIERVLSNLLSNALKFSPAGGTIRIRAYNEAGSLYAEVVDQGPGIIPEDLPKLFHRFAQLADGQRKGGTGLGLSISKAIIEAHGGQIGVRSQVGVGSTFWFRVPLDVADKGAA